MPAMKWILLAVAALAALALIVVVTGLLLPRDHVAALSARIAAPPDSVWAALTDPAGFPSWRPDVRRVEPLRATATGASWREHGSNGTITYVVEASEPPRRLVTRIADKDLPFGGSWEYTVAPDGAGSRVTIVERGSVYNPVFRFVSRFIMGHTATIERYLRALGSRFGGEAKDVRTE
jgi:uncharacterized protein YndB with AHSA1/START domain